MEEFCTWKDTGDSEYTTECYDEYYLEPRFNNLHEAKIKFCPYCGKKIIERINK